MNNILVSFWSPRHGQSGQTSNSVALAAYMGIMFQIKTLLMHSQFEKSNLETAFFEKVDDLQTLLFDETGVDALERLALTNQLCPSNFKDYTKNIIENRLDLLMGTNKTSINTYKSMANAIQFIVSCAKNVFDITICDVNAGDSFEVTGKILEKSDLVVVNLSQNIELLNAYFEKQEWHPALEGKKTIILIGNYDYRSKYSSGYIKKRFNIDDEVYVIHRNAYFMDAYNDHDVLKFFFANIDVGEFDDNYPFIYDLRKLSLRMLKAVKLDPSYVEKPLKSVDLFSSFLDLFNFKKK